MAEPMLATAATVASWPIKGCNGRFCGGSGPLTTAPILVSNGPSLLLVGLCKTCKRYVCSACALRRPHPESGSQRFALDCRVCGTPLGEGGEAILAGPAEGTDTDPLERLSDAVLQQVVRQVIESGFVATAGMNKACALLEQGPSEALTALIDEEERCLQAGYVAGRARALLEQATALYSLNRHAEALERAKESEPYLRAMNNRESLGRALFLRVILKDEEEDAEQYLALLREAANLLRESRHQQLMNHCLTERVDRLLKQGDIGRAVDDMLQMPDGLGMVERLTAQLAKTQQPIPRVEPGVEFDEGFIRQMRSTHRVWGCPAGCKVPGTLGLVALPMNSRPGMPCLMCGKKYICVNNYSALSASVPDRQPATILVAKQVPRGGETGLLLANLSLALRDHPGVTGVDIVQQRAVAAWEAAFGSASEGLALSLNVLARALQERDDHEAALELIRRAILIAESHEPPLTGALSSFLNNAGLSLACLGQWEEAEQMLRRAIGLDEKSPFPWYWLAKVLHRRGDVKEQEAWRAYLDRKPPSEARRREAEARLVALGG